MIPINELRIGNYALHGTTGFLAMCIKILEDNAEFKYTVGNYDYTWSKVIRPCPINKRILRKLGFTESKEMKGTWANGKCAIFFDNGIIYWHNTTIPFLHLFQNAYFFIMQEELKSLH